MLRANSLMDNLVRNDRAGPLAEHPRHGAGEYARGTDLAGVAAIGLGHPVLPSDVTPAQLGGQLRPHHAPDFLAQGLPELYAWFRAGNAATPTPSSRSCTDPPPPSPITSRHTWPISRRDRAQKPVWASRTPVVVREAAYTT